MRSIKPILALLLFVVFACEEQPNDTQPGTEEPSIKLSRVLFTNELTNETSLTEYTYEDGLLITATTDGMVTTYHYMDRVLSRVVSAGNHGFTNTHAYTYSDDKISRRMETADSSGVISAVVYEYNIESESQMRINHFYVEGNDQLKSSGHSICTVEEGNVTSEVGYDSRGSQTSHSESVFGTGLNPYSLWEGHPPITDKNLALSKEMYFLEELMNGWYRGDIELNEDNLPTQLILRYESARSASNVTKVEFFYE